MSVITTDFIRPLAPRARDDYVATLTSDHAWDVIVDYGISGNLWRFAGWLANVMHETGALRVVRESLNYTTAERLRQVWPSRFRDKSDDELAPLLHNERALANAVYNGRMGNAPDSDDGYTYRGWGFLQCTGRDNTLRLCGIAGVDPVADPSTLDDPNISLIVACGEWRETGCNELLDQNKFDEACAVINVGSVKLVKAVEGLADRRAWYQRIEALLQENSDALEAAHIPLSAGVDYDPAAHQQDPHWSEGEIST